MLFLGMVSPAGLKLETLLPHLPVWPAHGALCSEAQFPQRTEVYSLPGAVMEAKTPRDTIKSALKCVDAILPALRRLGLMCPRLSSKPPCTQG